MAVLTPPRPDLLAYREATTLEFSKLVTELTAILGKKLTAYIASVKDARAIERWMAGSEPYKGVEERLRLAYRLAKMISDHEGPRVVQAWFTGLNPELNDRVPVRLLREENVEDVGPEILGAARAFLAGGQSFLKVPGVIYRLGRKPDPWSVPDWASAGPDGTFGNRFDDPEGMYRVLYASSQRLGCFLETLGRFRVDPKLLAELAEIEGEDDYCPLGEVPLEWGEKRVMGVATAGGEYADICASEWIGRLRNLLAVDLVKFGFDDLDASVLQQTAPRNVTQLASRIVFNDGLAGIYYRSKYGHDVENWALFEPFQINAQDPEPIRLDDPDLQRALQLHSLKFKN